MAYSKSNNSVLRVIAHAEYILSLNEKRQDASLPDNLRIENVRERNTLISLISDLYRNHFKPECGCFHFDEMDGKEVIIFSDKNSIPIAFTLVLNKKKAIDMLTFYRHVTDYLDELVALNEEKCIPIEVSFDSE